MRCVRPDVECTEALVGGAALAAGLPALPPETQALCDRSDAILFGSVGLPQYDGIPLAQRPEYALFLLRRDYELYANLRPVRVFPGLEDASSLRPEIVRGLDLIVVRELTGGIYYGLPKEQRTVDGVDEAVDTMIYRAPEIERIARIAFELARARRKHLTSVDKQNILETSRLWRRVVNEMSAEYPDVRLEHLLVDNAAMQLVARPGDFDVIVTENMFGDILSDEAAILTGSIGTLPSASLGARRLSRTAVWALRADRRHGARLGGQGRRKSNRGDSLGRDAAAPQPRRRCIRGAHRARRRPRLRRRFTHRRGCALGRRRRIDAGVHARGSREALVRPLGVVVVGDLAADEIDEAHMQHRVRMRVGGAPSGAPAPQHVSLHRGDGIVVHVEVALQVEADDQRVRRADVEAHHDAGILRSSGATAASSASVVRSWAEGELHATASVATTAHARNRSPAIVRKRFGQSASLPCVHGRNRMGGQRHGSGPNAA